MIFKTLILSTFTTFCIFAKAQETLNIADLGQLNLHYTNIKHVESVALQPIKATVTHKTGEAYQMVAPFEPQRHEFLVGNGEYVESGKAVMLLSGSEVHHFLEQFESAKALFNLAKNRYELNKKLFKQKSISNDKWLSISQSYFENKIEYGHFRHFNELIHSIKSEDEIVIKAPLDGYFFYPDLESINASELKLGQVLPKESLRVKTYINIDEATKIKNLETIHCLIKVDEVSQVAEGLFLKTWSNTITDECQLSFGQVISVIPHLSTDAYQVPKSSVFTIDRSYYVLVKKGTQLKVTPISLIEASNTFYYIESATDLNNQEVLSTSVSAVQGVLMGLGGE